MITDNEQQPDLNSWDDFAGEYLKTEFVTDFPLIVVPTKLEAGYDKDDKPRLTINFLYKGKNKKLELNRTNQTFIRNSKLMPKQIIGKKLYFDKVKVRNPSTNSQVDSFLLVKIE